jgi:predicted glutamine amidotransferase
MCRMIGFISFEKKELHPYFKALEEQALHGKGGPHGDGWGMVAYGDQSLLMRKSAKPLWEASLNEGTADVALFHARQASFKGAELRLSHPFVHEMNGEIWAFAHNGTIQNLAPFASDDEIDTQIYSKLFISYLKNDTPVNAARRTVQEIIKIAKSEFTSLNAIIINAHQMLTFRIVQKDPDDYHTLFYSERSDSLTVSTEKFGEDEWTLLENGEYLFASKFDSKIDFEVGKIFK